MSENDLNRGTFGKKDDNSVTKITSANAGDIDAKMNPAVEHTPMEKLIIRLVTG